MAVIKHGTHTVFKNADADKYLTEVEGIILFTLLNKIAQGRLDDGKDYNSYWICNTDEPYIEAVKKAILDGESAKEVTP